VRIKSRYRALSYDEACRGFEMDANTPPVPGTICVRGGEVVNFKDWDDNGVMRLASFVRLLADALKRCEEDINANVQYCPDDRGMERQGCNRHLGATVTFASSRPVDGATAVDLATEWCGDFGFDVWFGKDYTVECTEISMAGLTQAVHQKACWRGNLECHTSRMVLLALQRSSDRGELLSVEGTCGWNGKTHANYMSMAEQTRQFAYLIDCPGHGYSGRTKRLLWSNRPLLIIQPEYTEHWCEQLEPMKHYVPIHADLSDLIERIRWLEDNPCDARRIAKSAYAFAQQHLQRHQEVDRMAVALSRTST
jgi:hypothetical protein